VQDFATIHSMMVEIMEIYDFNDQLDLIGLMLGYASLGSRTTLKNRTKKKSSFNSKKWTFLWDI
jgi:lysine/ornithine N-monooxygenase